MKEYGNVVKGRLIHERTMYNNVIGFLLISCICFQGLLFATGMIIATTKTGDTPWLIAGWFLFIISAIGFGISFFAAIKMNKLKIYENGIIYPLPFYKNIQYRRKYREPGIFYYYDDVEEIRKLKKWDIEIRIPDGIRGLMFRQKTRDKIYYILINARKRHFERKGEPGES